MHMHMCMHTLAGLLRSVDTIDPPASGWDERT